jgi:hypothetical protein
VGETSLLARDKWVDNFVPWTTLKYAALLASHASERRRRAI